RGTEALGGLMQSRAQSRFREQRVSAHHDIEFEVVVGLIAMGGAKHPAFPAAVATAQEHTLQASAGGQLEHGSADLLASSLQMSLQRIASVASEALTAHRPKLVF